MTDTPQSGWLIHKAGRGWYRPNAQGYTSDTAQAGRYSYEEARSYSHPNGWSGPRDGITITHEDQLQSARRAAPAADDATAALQRVRQIALQSEAAPLSMGEIVKRVDVALGEDTPLPAWMAAPAADDLRAAARRLLDAKAYEMTATGAPLDKYSSNWMKGALIWIADPANAALLREKLEAGPALGMA